MGRNLLFKERLDKWIEVDPGCWEYIYYKYCMLTVRRDKDGKYIGAVNGDVNVKIEDWKFNDPDILKFDTVEDAQKHLMAYMDNLRQKEAEEAQRNEAYRMALLKAYVANRE